MPSLRATGATELLLSELRQPERTKTCDPIQMALCEINERVTSWNKIRIKILMMKSSLKRAKTDEAS